MDTLNNILADFLPESLNLVIIIVLIRFYLITGIFLVLVLARTAWYNSRGIVPNSDNRISSYSTTDVNFNKFLTGFSKPFSLNKVY